MNSDISCDDTCRLNTPVASVFNNKTREAGIDGQQVSANTSNIVSQTCNCNGGEPEAYEFNTPLINNEPEVSRCWSNEDLQALQQWKQYANNLYLYVCTIEQQGFRSPSKIPSKPRKSLQWLLGKSSNNKQPPLTGEELHKYLVSKIVDTKHNVIVHTWNNTSLQTAIPTLRNGNTICQQHNARLVEHYLNYGNVLGQAHDLFDLDKIKKEIPSHITWKYWLKSNLNISDTHARQMIDLYNQFGEYRLLYYLGISLNELIKRKKEIRLLFKMNPNCAEFWRPEPTKRVL